MTFEAPKAVGQTRALDVDEKFPHLYGPVEPSAVVKERAVLRQGDGTFVGIEGITGSEE